MFIINKNKFVRNIDSRKIDKIVQNLSKFKKLKNKKFENLMYIEAIKKPMFLIFNAKKILNNLL